MTESEMNAIRELFTEMGATLADEVERRLSPQYLGIQKTVDAVARDQAKLQATVNGLASDVAEVKESLALLTSKRLAQIESRLDALEERQGS